MRRSTIALTVGCPSGVGPEVAVAAAIEAKSVRCILVGDEQVVRRAARLRGVQDRRLVRVGSKRAAGQIAPDQIGVWAASTRLCAGVTPGQPSHEAGAAQLAWIDEGTDLVLAGVASALVTGPVSKHAIASSGNKRAATFVGHTEHLARRLGAREVVMAFRSAQITTALVTTHLALAKVPEQITARRVATSTYWLARLVDELGCHRPRLAVAALNPHAGEGGLLGTEETTRITPGIARARQRLAREGRPVEISGPIGAETAFRLHIAGAYDGVVAMYHDQATIPTKLLGFGEAVNVTLGLPIIRTSVDHGTGYDIAWTGRADARGMAEAIALAAELVRVRPRAARASGR
jgi:4-hydroxythreonine-4-phosphate dehydrogenase